MRESKQSTTSGFNVVMVSTADYYTGVTGLTLSVTLSKNGGTFASVSPTITERGNGLYFVEPLAAHRDTVGENLWHFTGTGAIPYDYPESIVANIVSDAVSGISTVDGKVDTVDGIVDTLLLDTTDIKSRLPAALSGGRMVARVESMADDVITASTLAATVAQEIAAGVETALVNDSDATAVLQAIADKVASDWVAGDVSAAAVAAACRDAILDRVLSGNHDTSDTPGALLQSIATVLTNLATTDGKIDDLTTSVGNLNDIDGTGLTVDLNPDQSGVTIGTVNQVPATVATAANQTTILNRLGAFTGSGVNTVLGFFRALMSKAASTPSDVGGTFAPSSDSAEAISEAVASIEGGGGGSEEGNYTATITVQDEDENPLESVNVTLRKGVDSRVRFTNADGETTAIPVSEGTWSVILNLTGYDSSVQSLVVSNANVTPTYTLTATSVSPSAGDDFVTAYGTTLNHEGDPEASVSVTCVIANVGTADAGYIYDTATRTATSNASGVYQFDRIRKGATYRFKRGSTYRDVTIPTNAADPYPIPSFYGSDS